MIHTNISYLYVFYLWNTCYTVSAETNSRKVVLMTCFLGWIFWYWVTFGVWLSSFLHFFYFTHVSFQRKHSFFQNCIFGTNFFFFYHWFISRVSLQYEFSDCEWGDDCDEMLCHIPYISNISLQYDLSDVEKDLNSGKRICHMLYIYKVFPRYGFADVDLNWNSA